MTVSTNGTGPRRGRRAAAGLAAAALFAAGGAAAAERGGPAVHIDPAALEALGPPRGAPPVALSAPEPAPEPETGPDGLPIYDAGQGPPRSRLIGEFATGADSADSGDAAAGAENAVSAVAPESGPETAGPDVAPPRPSVRPPPPPTEAAPAPAAIAAAPLEPPPVAAPPAPPPLEPASAAPPAAAAARPLASVAFAPGESDVAPAGRAELGRIAATLAADPALDVQLKAYADAAGISPSGARRLSLLRALSVRALLMESDIDATRIDVRALGAKYETGPADRVDIVGVR